MRTLSTFKRDANSRRFDVELAQEPDCLIRVLTIAQLQSGPVLVGDVRMRPADLLKIAEAAQRLALQQRRETIH